MDEFSHVHRRGAICLVSTSFHIYWAIGYASRGHWLAVTHEILMINHHGFLIAVCFPWYPTQNIWAALTKHRVAAVWENVKLCDTTSPEWEELVVSEVLTLVTDTLPTLSAGWRGGAAGLCLTCWSLAASYTTWALHVNSVEGKVSPLLIALVAAAVPVLLLWDLDDVSTEYDHLVVDLNDKRTNDSSDKAHQAIMKLEIMLGHLNKNQGLGFVLYMPVIDKQYFFQFFMKLSLA
jgi:hypothetical protein